MPASDAGARVKWDDNDPGLDYMFHVLHGCVIHTAGLKNVFL